jgi:hypothetical protein
VGFGVDLMLIEFFGSVEVRGRGLKRQKIESEKAEAFGRYEILTDSTCLENQSKVFTSL